MTLTSNKFIEKILFALFFGLLFLKDFIGFSVPSIAFTIIWIAILFIGDRSTGAAFCIASVICFASTMSITIPLMVYVVLTIIRNKGIKVNAISLVSLLVIVVELIRFINVPNENFNVYVNTMSVLLTVCVAIMELHEGNVSAEKCLKFFIAFFVVMSLDIVLATAKLLGGIGAIFSSSFRIGQVDLIDESMTGIFGVNSNGIALMAVLAISATMLLLSKKQLKLRYVIPLVVYFSVIGFMTVSKTFMLVYIAYWLIYIFWYTLRSGGNLLKPLSLIAVAGVIVALVWNTSAVQNILARFEEGDLTTGRVDVMYLYLDFMGQNEWATLFGIGLQNVTSKVGLVNVPHNAILEIFVCLGGVGLIAYAVFFVSYFRLGMQAKNRLGKEPHSFLNYVPFIVFFVFIQSLQFLRINYIYASIALVFACMVLNKQKETQLKGQK